MTRTVLGLVTITIAITLACISFFWVMDWVEPSAFPIIIPLQIMAVLSWWLSTKGFWRVASHVPSILFFYMGMYGAYNHGYTSYFAVFFAIAFLTSGLLVGTRTMIVVLILSLVSHFTTSWFVFGTPQSTMIYAEIVLTATFIGFALLQWLSLKLLNQVISHSVRDALTGALNRSFFEAELERIQADQRRHGYPVSIITVDLNRLKSVNDRFGHRVGDKILIRAAETLQKAFRKEDMVCRIGGDEFAVLLPRLDASTLENVVNRLKELVYENNRANADRLLSFAIGVATATEGEPLQETLYRADLNMYEDKKHAKKQSGYPVNGQTKAAPNRVI